MVRIYNMDKSKGVKIKSPKGLFWLGNTYCLGFNGKIYLSVGPDWPLNVVMGIVIIAGNLFFVVFMAAEVVFIMKCLGFFIYFGCFVCYCVTSLKDPGILMTPWELELEEGKCEGKVCVNCDLTCSNDSEHCFECGVCIKGYDHHCPLSGKCIGSGNIIPFYGFLTLAFFGLVYLWKVSNEFYDSYYSKGLLRSKGSR